MKDIHSTDKGDSSRGQGVFTTYRVPLGMSDFLTSSLKLEVLTSPLHALVELCCCGKYLRHMIKGRKIGLGHDGRGFCLLRPYCCGTVVRQREWSRTELLTLDQPRVREEKGKKREKKGGGERRGGGSRTRWDLHRDTSNLLPTRQAAS